MELDVKKLMLRAGKIVEAQKNPAFLQSLKALQKLGFLYSPDFKKTDRITTKLRFKDVDAAARLEPRIAEVLPAAYIRRPKMFLSPNRAPADLKKVAEAWRQKGRLPMFRGIEPEKYGFWIEHFRRKGSSERKVLKTFRFSKEELGLLARVRQKLKADCDAETLRLCLAEVDKNF